MLAYTREKLVAHLLEIPALNDLYGEFNPDYVRQVVAWMGCVEQTLVQIRSPLAAVVASERGKVLAACDGFREGLTVIQESSARSRKVIRAAAALGVVCVQESLSFRVSEIDRQFDEIRGKIAQLLAVSSSQTAISMPRPGQCAQDWYAEVWKQILTQVNAGTQGMVDYLSAALKSSDLMYVLGDTLENLAQNRTSALESFDPVYSPDGKAG